MSLFPQAAGRSAAQGSGDTEGWAGTAGMPAQSGTRPERRKGVQMCGPGLPYIKLPLRKYGSMAKLVRQAPKPPLSEERLPKRIKLMPRKVLALSPPAFRALG